MTPKITVIGAGLAGAEAAWQAAEKGFQVRLYEMRPEVMTPAHHTGYFAELVCSNSLRADSLENAAGLLKEEMRRLNSLIMNAADENKVPAGGALAVDRERFAQMITKKIKDHPLIDVIQEEIRSIPEHRPLIIATGPLTSTSLAEKIKEITGEAQLYFYDSAAPIVTADSLDFNRVFRASRYGKGSDDYLNCPMNEKEYDQFWLELTRAEQYSGHEFEKEVFFEGCMPVEVLAARGKNTLLFGPMKPVGLIDPRTNEQPYAVVQLRQDNREATLYNMVGFQTRLKWPEQKRVFRLIPGLENAEFVRYGVMHRNTFIKAPLLLEQTLEFKRERGIFFAGQITGVEGYIESTATGLIAGLNAAAFCRGENLLVFPPETAHGALCHYLLSARAETFQPMNINYGLLPPLKEKTRKKERRRKMAERALQKLSIFKKNF